MLVIVGKQCSDFTNQDGILQIGQMVLSMSVPICVTTSIGHCVYDLRHFKAGHPWCHLECEKYLFCLTHRQPWRVWRVLEGCENLCGKAVKTLFNQHCQWVKDYNDTVCMWCFYFIFTRWLLLKKMFLKQYSKKYLLAHCKRTLCHIKIQCELVDCPFLELFKAFWTAESPLTANIRGKKTKNKKAKTFKLNFN